MKLVIRSFCTDILKEPDLKSGTNGFQKNPLVDEVPQPFKWDEKQRLKLRRELDSVYTHLYGI